MTAARRALTSDRSQRLLVAGAVVSALVIGVRSAGDFGVSWDEPDYYHYGELVQHFYATGDRSFEEFSNLRYYGAATPLLHAAIADAVDQELVDAFALAHLVNYLIFLAGAVALYALIRLHTGSRLWALLGATVLLLSPRIFSHAFVNPKDGPFLALTTVVMALLVHYMERRRAWMLWALGVASGLLVGVRVTGLLIVVIVIVALRAEAWAEATSEARDRWAGEVVRYAIAIVPVTLLTWPYLWPNPPLRFTETLATMSSFTSGPQEMLYLGGLAEVETPPWHYVPVWMGITTPVLYLLLAAVGAVVALSSRPAEAYRSGRIERHHYLYATWLLLPIAVVIVGRSALYDEWRHVNFVYPALVIFVVLGARWLWAWASSRHKVLGGVFLGLLLCGIALVGRQMAQLHPYQAVYFNQLIGGIQGADGRFELDYWGMSYRDGLAHLLDVVPAGPIELHACTIPGVFNAGQVEGGERIRFVENLQEADFAICAPRDRDLLDASHGSYLPERPTLMTVSRGGVTMLWVKDLRGS